MHSLDAQQIRFTFDVIPPTTLIIQFLYQIIFVLVTRWTRNQLSRILHALPSPSQRHLPFVEFSSSSLTFHRLLSNALAHEGSTPNVPNPNSDRLYDDSSSVSSAIVTVEFIPRNAREGFIGSTKNSINFDVLNSSAKSRPYNVKEVNFPTDFHPEFRG